jgi:PAS domain S-box-containing protein
MDILKETGMVLEPGSADERCLVVVVDDQSAGRKILERLVSDIDPCVDVATFGDAPSAIEFIRGSSPDLIITDYLMPEMDGVGFLRWVRQIPGCTDVPIIVITVSSDVAVRYQALDAGATDFLGRPIDPHECQTRCRNLLTMRRQQKALSSRARALAESERRFRIMADELPLMIWVHDESNSLAFVNRTCATYFGALEQELVGRHWHGLVHPDDRDAYLRDFAASCDARVPFHGECRFRRADGEWRVLESFGRPFYSGSGRFGGIVGTSLDITERKCAEEALRFSHEELQRHAEQLSHLTSQLALTEQRERERLAKVLHDHLQQLLVGAAFGLERLSRRLNESPPAPGVSESLADVGNLLQQAIAAGRDLVADLTPPILHEAGLAEALEWLARAVRDNYGLQVALNLDPALSPARDDVRSVLFESVREALFNVVKHADCDTCELAMNRADNDRLALVVSDRGRGFDPERLTSGPAGTGFGLLSMRERLRFLGGSVRIESAPGEGTSVTLWAPLGGESIALESRTPSPPRLEADGELDDAPVRDSGSRLRLLLVDDHAMMRQGLLSMLCDEPDLDVVGEASNGHEAIGQVERLRPDIVLMDYSMPGMDGVEATRLIAERWKDVRVIGLSMYEEEDRASAMLEAGAVSYLVKTGDADALLAAIRALRDPPERRPSASV